jgi:hypothetical protein
MTQQPAPVLSGTLDPATQAAFDRLQAKLVPLWQHIGRSDPGGPIQAENTVVVVPSISLEIDEPASAIQAFEQRFLFLLFLLRQPGLRLIYVTSLPIQENIIDYYLATLPGVIFSNARKRLFLINLEDASSEPLSKKLLARPHIIARIRSLIPDMDRAHVVPYNTTDLERELALQLGIPMYGADPAFYAFGTKSGGRRIFAEEGLSYPLGREDLFSEEELVDAVRQMRAEKPGIQKLIVKLNEGVGGEGNATVDLQALPTPGDAAEPEAVTRAVRAMHFERSGVTYERYLPMIHRGGAIIEELISGRSFRSPSAQLRITPLGQLEMLSTHDQILGGPGGQSFLGSRFPAHPDYAWPIMSEAAKIGRRLANEGVLGRFAVDFVVVQADDGGWTPYAIEINLRKGGTTAPFLTLQYLTDGYYDAQAGVFTTVRGERKHYVSSDHVESPDYRVFTPDSLFDIVSRHRLHYDHASHTGVVLHMLSNVGGSGQFGVTAIADSDEEADALYRRFLDVLDQEVRYCWQV